MKNSKIKDRFSNLPEECYECTRFKDLEVGDKYISLPLPGDNSGHGGFKNGSYLFQKIEEIESNEWYKPNSNTIRLNNDMQCHMPDSAPVLKII